MVFRSIKECTKFTNGLKVSDSPGYLREEIILTSDVSRSAVISHEHPSQSELCSVCGQLVQCQPSLQSQETRVRPLDFTYNFFCQRSGLKLHQRLISVEHQPIVMHSLHVTVLQEGGRKNVSGIVFFCLMTCDRLRTMTCGISLALVWILLSSLGP